MSLDVMALAEQDTRLHKEARGEYAGPCPDPDCGRKTDGFRVKWNGEKWAFMCRGCWDSQEILSEEVAKVIGKLHRIGEKRGWGDEIDYLRHFKGMRFQEAKAYLQGDEGTINVSSSTPKKPYHKASGFPDTAWQEKAHAYAKSTIARLWDSEGAQALTYLHSRGLQDETIRKARLGFDWRVHPKTQQNVPCLVIPWYEQTAKQESALWRVQFRDIRPDSQERYFMLPGGSNAGLYLAECLKIHSEVFIVEGELDALTIAQEAGKLVGVVATGTTEGSRNARWLARLACVPHILVAFDNDKKGEEAAQYWLSRLDNARRYRPLANDANEMHMQGYSLREWVQGALSLVTPEEEEEPLSTETEDQIAPVYTQESHIEGCTVCQAEVAYYSNAGVPYCLVHWPYGEDGEVIPIGAVCCSCNAPAKHASPGGYTYCDTHYQCRRGHAIRWRQDDSGRWICACYWEYQTIIEEEAASIRKHGVPRKQEAPRKPYTPLTLAALPRKQCPHHTITLKSEGRNTLALNGPLCGQPATYQGWCEEHALSHDLLDLGAILGYPDMRLNEYRGILDGQANWEGYAEIASQKWLVRDISFIRAALSSLLEDTPTPKRKGGRGDD